MVWVRVGSWVMDYIHKDKNVSVCLCVHVSVDRMGWRC